jgi:hypothetical protein
MNETIQIPAPKFEPYELVTLQWNGVEYKTRIVECSFRLSAQEWVYQVAEVSNELAEGRYFYADVLQVQA